MLDAVMFRLYGTFATNQTGNTVFLTLAVLHWGTAKLILAMASLGGFFGAGLVMGQIGARLGESCTSEYRWGASSGMAHISLLSQIACSGVTLAVYLERWRNSSEARLPRHHTITAEPQTDTTGHRRRAWVVTSMVYQCVILFIFTWVVSPCGHYMVAPGGPHEWVGMLLSAIQGGPQVVMVSDSPEH